ncbi:bestrophin family protein [Lichenicola sp.]|uniref:bestrophin family protein n=1 Tax=Lichenicola sp. TaxID=2804529 RepID=UPI003B00C88D
MIVGRRAGIARLLTESVRPLLVLFAWDIIVVLLFQLAHRSWMDQPALPYSLIGSALVLFLSVRNTTAYNRWWEARTLWGGVVNNTRSFSRQMATLLDGAPDLTRAMIAYAHALRGGLAGMDVSPDLQRFLKPEFIERVRQHRNQPNTILYEIGVGVRARAIEAGVHPAAQAAIDRILSDLANAQGGLERIRNTPLAIQFSALPRMLVRVFCVVLPLSMVQELGWITPFGSTLVGFLFVALDEIGADLESPFEPGPHAVPMSAITRTIEIDLCQAIGDPAPEPMLPVKGVLA